MTEKQRNCFNVPAGKKSWTSALTGTTTNYHDILQDYQPYCVTFQEFVTKQLTHFCLCGWWLMFGSSLQLGDCCLYPAAFQVNLLFPVNVAWQFLTWLAFCCLQQRFNHSHTGRGEWACVCVCGGGAVWTLWVLLKYSMLIKQTTGKAPQFYCRSWSTITVWSWLCHSKIHKKKKTATQLSGVTLLRQQNKVHSSANIYRFVLAFVSGCHDSLISRQPPVSAWPLCCLCLLFTQFF